MTVSLQSKPRGTRLQHGFHISWRFHDVFMKQELIHLCCLSGGFHQATSVLPPWPLTVWVIYEEKLQEFCEC